MTSAPPPSPSVCIFSGIAQLHLLWVIIQIVNGFWWFNLILSNNRIAVFLEQKKNVQITDHTWRAFQLLVAVISSASGQICFGWKILSTPTWKLFWKITSSLGLYLLRNLGHNNNSTQNENVFQITARNLEYKYNPIIQSCY